MDQIIGFNDLKVGQRVKVEGRLDEDGAFVALKIGAKAPEDEGVIEGLIQSIDHQKNTLCLLNREFILPDEVKIKDLHRDIISFKDIKAGDRVKLKGKYSELKGFVPEKIIMQEDTDYDIVELQGKIDKIDLRKKTLDVLGFTVIVKEQQELVRQSPNAQGLTIISPIHHNSQERLNEFYSNPKVVEAYLDPARLKFYHDVVKLLHEKGIGYNGKHIADIGCGTGHLFLSIRNNFNPASLTGFEYSEAALRIARAVVPDTKFYYFDIYEGGINFQFDVVFCVEVLEHLLYPDKALMTITTMINASGVALITVPNGRIDTYEGHINFWSPESWEVFVKSVCHSFDVKTGLVDDGKTNFAIVSNAEVYQL